MSLGVQSPSIAAAAQSSAHAAHLSPAHHSVRMLASAMALQACHRRKPSSTRADRASGPACRLPGARLPPPTASRSPPCVRAAQGVKVCACLGRHRNRNEKATKKVRIRRFRRKEARGPSMGRRPKRARDRNQNRFDYGIATLATDEYSYGYISCNTWLRCGVKTVLAHC